MCLHQFDHLLGIKKSLLKIRSAGSMENTFLIF